jgi:hypothetical protein
LRQLNRKHPEQAQTLFGEIVDKLKHVDLESQPGAFSFASSLAASFASSATNSLALRDLASLFIHAAEAYGCHKKPADNDVHTYFCSEIGRILPLFDKVNGERNARLKQWQPEDSDDSPQTYSLWEELNEVTQEGTVDDILALEKTYPQMRESIYDRAFYKAQTTGDLDRARKIAEETPEGVRRYMLEGLERQEKIIAKFREGLKDIDRTLEELPNIEQRVDFLLRAAGTISQTDRKEAVKLLDRANGLVDTMRPGSDQLQLQMVLAIAYSVNNSNRGIVMIELLIPKLNELVSAAAKLDGYETHHLRDGEWNMSAEGPLGTLFTGVAQSASYFAWCDFDRAVSVAGQFERPELRLMAQVKLAQGIVAGRPKNPRMQYPPSRY